MVNELRIKNTSTKKVAMYRFLVDVNQKCWGKDILAPLSISIPMIRPMIAPFLLSGISIDGMIKGRKSFETGT